MNTNEPNFQKQEPTNTNFPRINKLKIVGNGLNNWSVATSGPFYLIEAENNSSQQRTNNELESSLTGSTNLIHHYGLLSTYHKFCGKPLKPTLSSFLPNIAGNIDEPAEINQSGLMTLYHKPPISKEIVPLSSNLMAESFRLHSDTLPHLAKLFTSDNTRLDNSNSEPGVSSLTNDNLKSSSHKKHKPSKKRAAALDISLSDKPPTPVIPQNTPVTTTNSASHTPNVVPSNPSVSQQTPNVSSSVPETTNTIVEQNPSLSVQRPVSADSSKLLPNMNSYTPNPSLMIIKPKKAKKCDDEEKKKKKKKKKDKKKEKFSS